MNISNKILRRAFFVAAAVLVLLCVAAVHVMYRISQNRDGICAAEGRVLSDEELRRRVVENVVKHEIDVAEKHDSVIKVGIAPDMSEADLVSIIENAYHNEKSVEDYFSIENVYSPLWNSNSFNVSALSEPFVLVVYSDSSANLYPTASVQRELIDARDIDHHFDIAETYLGFSRNFYQISVVYLPGYCCYKQPSNLRRDEYLAKKMAKYQRWLSEEREITIYHRLMAASNCGDVLKRPDEQNYRTLGISQIDFLRRK